MTLTIMLQLIGGLGLFLFGMNLMTASLKESAGPETERLLKKLTSNPLRGVLLGAGVTAVIQSSTATTLMSMGFVGAGAMSITQAVPVIMGANVGTTVTAQLLSLNDISGSNIFLTLLKPSSFAPFFILIGTTQLFFLKKERRQSSAKVFAGLGILFTGMSAMETSLAPLKDSEIFHKVFLGFSHPLLGILLGTAATAVLQSSSACVGILQALSTTGAVPFATAAPIILGINIGKCLPEFLACVGANREAQKTITADLLINVIGTAVFFVTLYTAQKLTGFSFWDSPVNRSSIAMFHTVFNAATTAFLLPFYKKIIRLSDSIVAA